MGIRILYNYDTWDGATITSSSEASTDLADDNTVDDLPGRVWRTTGASSESIVFDFGSAVNFDIFGIFNHNFTSGATVKLQANGTDSWGSPSYNQTLTIATDADSVVLPRLVYFPSNPTARRYWRVSVQDSSNPDGYIEIGRLIAGSYYEPSRSVADGLIVTDIDPSEGFAGPGTAGFWRVRPKYRRAAILFPLYTATQADELYAFFSKVGRTRPIVLALDPTSRPSEDSMYCYFKSNVGQIWREAGIYDSAQLDFEEAVE